MTNYEKLGAFYLGRVYDISTGRTREDLLLYDSKDLTTHAVCVGMTGSGKTGLCVGLLEEAAIDGIPSLVIDPKGDLGNLMLTFPGLNPSDFRPWIEADEAARKGFSVDVYAAKTAELWRKGLSEWDQDSERIARFKNSVDMAIYTPGSNAGLPLSVLQSLESPPSALLKDEDAFRDRVLTLVSGLLALLGISADPIQSREHILLSNIFHQVWSRGQSLSIAGLIQAIQSPPFTKVGVFDLESFYSSKERFELAIQLNNLLASPGFSTWMEGEPLDVARLLYTAAGKPRVAILSIAHLSERERIFFVTIFLNEVISWMRSQPGTSSLRCLLYMDEIFGFFPPTANPPTKTPMLTLLKQARAYGLGVVLATQNPVDLDYKGLSNAGTWFIGRLQTARDKERVLEGLEGASVNAGVAFDKAEIDKTLSALGQRVFLMHNVHEDAPVLFQTRWALSYLRGPLTRAQIQTLMLERKQEPAQEIAQTTPVKPFQRVPSPETPPALETQKPVLPPEIPELFLPLKGSLQAAERLHYRPLIYGSGKLHYVSSPEKIDLWQTISLLSPLSPEQLSVSWEEAYAHSSGDIEFEKEGMSHAQFGQLPVTAMKPASYKSWKTSLVNHLYQNRVMTLRKSPELKKISNPGESEGDFRARLGHLTHENRDLEVEKLRKRYTPQLARLQERLRQAEVRVTREKSQYSQQKVQTAISLGATVLGALFGRKVASTGNIGRATTTMRGAGRAAREKEDIDRAMREVLITQEKLHELEMAFQEEMERVTGSFDPGALDLTEVVVRPRKSDIYISSLSLVWGPWKVGLDGLTEPFFYPELRR